MGVTLWLRSRVAGLMVATCVLVGCAGAPDPANELPFGSVDMPQSGAVVAKGPIVVGGWAMDDAGVTRVRVYVNRRFVTESRLEVARPDLIKVFPAYLHGSEFHGWNVTVVLPTPGVYEILAQATDTDGATRDLGVVAITVVD